MSNSYVDKNSRRRVYKGFFCDFHVFLIILLYIYLLEINHGFNELYQCICHTFIAP